MVADQQFQGVFVELDVAACDEAALLRLLIGMPCMTPDDIADTQYEFIDVEGLGDVVIGADLETMQPVGPFIPRR
jgi:hypothetical protein